MAGKGDVGKIGDSFSPEWRISIKKKTESYQRSLTKMEDLGPDATQLKIKLMTSRISELEEEIAACLDMMDDMLQKLASSKRNEELHRIETEKLKSVVSNALKVIQRAKEEDSMDDAIRLNLGEVTREELPGSEDIFSGHVVRSDSDGQLSATVSVSVETESTEEN